MDRYIRNMNCITKEDTLYLHNVKVCVVGCGGLGGYVIEMLSRIGVGYITGIDPDAFDVTNLNRQIISNTYNIGSKKTLEAEKRVKLVNPDVIFNPVSKALSKDNAEDLLADHDIVIDAVDSISVRLLIQDTCKSLQIPMVHGAIAGWFGQVSVIMPGDDTLTKLYSNSGNKGAEISLGNPSFIPGLVASIEVSEALKILLKKGELLRKKLLYIDLLNHTYEIIEI